MSGKSIYNYESLMELPNFLWSGWVKYKGEIKFAMVNVEKSVACHRPIIDIAYCATEGIHGNIETSVNYVKGNFRRHIFKRGEGKPTPINERE